MIIVARSQAAARIMHVVGPIHVRVARVGAHHRHDVEHPFVEQPGDEILPAVRFEQVPGGIERHFDALYLIGVNAGVDPKCRFLVFRTAREVGDRNDPHFSTAVGLAQAGEPTAFGMSGDELFEKARHRRVIAKVIPRGGNLGVRGSTLRLVTFLTACAGSAAARSPVASVAASAIIAARRTAACILAALHAAGRVSSGTRRLIPRPKMRQTSSGVHAYHFNGKVIVSIPTAGA